MRGLEKRDCEGCGDKFQPKPMGYNARYCADRCKRRAQRARLKEKNPDQLQKARARSYQQTKAHPERMKKHRECSNRHRREVREWLAAYKKRKGCVDCGYRAHAAALQLDHEGTKSVEIADARSSVRRLKEEIRKGRCKVRCANCHSIKTWERKNHGA